MTTPSGLIQGGLRSSYGRVKLKRGKGGKREREGGEEVFLKGGRKAARIVQRKGDGYCYPKS